MLILGFYLPLDEDEGQLLRQTIGLTLEEIPTILDCGEQLDDVFFITLQTLLNAPNTSPLSQVNVQEIIKFMLNLSSLCQRVSRKVAYDYNQSVRKTL